MHVIIGMFTTVRLPAGPSVPDTIPTVEPVANADFANAAGKFSGGGSNNLLDEEEIYALYTRN
jgi:hypothetical protein